MDIKSILQESWLSFSANPLRSALSVTGVIFGIASVIAMLNIGVGAEKQMNAMLSAMGEHNIHIIGKEYDIKRWSSVLSKTNGLSYRDVQAVKEFFPESVIVPLLSVKLENTVPHLESISPTLIATNTALNKVTNLSFAAGRAFSSYEEKLGTPVAILGGNVAKQWFGNDASKALHKEIRLNSGWFFIIGVLSSSELNSSHQISSSLQSDKTETDNTTDSNMINFDDSIITSFSATHSRVIPKPNVAEYSRIIVKLRENESPVYAQNIIQKVEDNLNRGEQTSDVIAAIQVINQKKKTTNLFTYFLLSIASISLIVGGIGIANVMLASMQERIYEVGLRRAIGARRKDILLQFLVECVVICFLGGIIGTIIGIVGAIIVVKITSWPLAFPWWSITISVGISVIVGILSGIYPAIKASSINPVNALQGRI